MSTMFPKLFKIETQLLVGRLLTRSGDQAWDFGIPFALLHVFPGQLQIAALYYLIVKIGTFILTPWVGKWIDSNQRLRVVKVGVWLQFFAVLGGILCFYVLDGTVHKRFTYFEPGAVMPLFYLLSLIGIFASLGSLITDIAVGNDLAPALIPAAKLTQFNSWLRRIDLGTEVGAPVVAGLLFALEFPDLHLVGLLSVALWNLISFVPEYFLLINVIRKSGLSAKETASTKSWKELFHIDLKESVANPVFWLICSYALLWLSVLSPHGVLLAGYLMDKMSLPASEIGIFRGLGAVFGLLSTLTFPFLVNKVGLMRSSGVHLAFQGLVLILGIGAFMADSPLGIYIFLACILLSRIGLYGFSNGEFELRQRLIPESQRGQLNSLSYLATTMATLVLFGLGSLLPSTEDFRILVYLSLVAVIIANLVFFVWAKGTKLSR